MSVPEIRAAVIAMLVHELGIAKNRVMEIDLTTHIADDLGADSLSLVELHMSLEERFGIEVPDEHAGALFDGHGTLPFTPKAALGTVGALCEYLERVGAAPMPEPVHGW